MKKLTVAVVFGGRSAEHEISLLSAKNVVASLDPEKYRTVLIGIDRNGRWLSSSRPTTDGSLSFDGEERADTVHLDDDAHEVALVSTGPTSGLLTRDDPAGLLHEIDVIFPVLHGPYGEDGTIQGLAKLADIPCVGAGVLGSAVGMDKDVMKRLLRDADIPIAPFRTVFDYEWQARRGREESPGGAHDQLSYESMSVQLGTRLYVKPANLGSSVGISRANDPASFAAAVDLALTYDRKVVVESEISGREIEVSVLGNDEPLASVPGEIVPADGFYSYKAKYLDENGAELRIPADLNDSEKTTVQTTAIRTYRALCCEGMARIDGFLTSNGEFVVNEINTIPGFTRISMYPKLFEASGIGPSELTNRLIELALERHRKEQGLSLAPGQGGQG